MRNLATCIILSIFVIAACDKGLSPTEIPEWLSTFPVPPEGGDPVGMWIPDTTSPVAVGILDTSFVSLLDSLIIDTELAGQYVFSDAGVCSVHVLMTMNALAYIGGSPSPFITYTLYDTTQGKGAYQVIEDVALELPIQSTNFDFDTLGFTAYSDYLELITLPNVFHIEDFGVDIPLYFLFHLVRSSENTSSKIEDTLGAYHKKEDEP